MERQKWEYCTLVHNTAEDVIYLRCGANRQPLDVHFNEHFNVLGADGWEMCGCFPASETAYETAHFKRPKADA